MLESHKQNVVLIPLVEWWLHFVVHSKKLCCQQIDNTIDLNTYGNSEQHNSKSERGRGTESSDSRILWNGSQTD